MSDKNHKKNCAFAAEIVSYLYEEISKSEKTVFETHLANCGRCTDELADFSFARFAIKDWRDADFAHLKTPVIEIPFAAAPLKADVSADSVSLLANLRRIFSLPTVWATSAAAVAIAFGLFLTATNFFQPELFAEKKNGNSDGGSVLSSVKIEAVPTPALPSESGTVDSSVKSSNSSPKTSEPESRRLVRQNPAPEDRKDSVIKASVNSPKIKIVRESAENIGAASDLRKINDVAPKTAVRVNRPIPTLNSFEEEEDNTLRLAQMFEEIDAGK